MEKTQKTEKKLYCECCDYQANFLCEYNKHLNTQKHLRSDSKKTYKCTICDYIATTHWNQKMHIVMMHYTIEQKMELKYYCSLCDCVNFSSLYHKSHLNSKLHKKNIINKASNIIRKTVDIPTQLNDIIKAESIDIKKEIKDYIDTALYNTKMDLFNYIDKILN